MANMEKEAPAGFQLLPEGLGFTDVLRPLYRLEQDGELHLGMFVQPQLCNMMGICHGGALMTLADIGAATAINFSREKKAPTPTLNLSFDFINAAQQGDWLETHTDRLSLKNRFGFASGVILCGDKVIVRYSGTFYYPDHAGFKHNLDGVAKLHGQG
jgi:uncharacterized protein (TIGR00369 family)